MTVQPVNDRIVIGAGTSRWPPGMSLVLLLTLAGAITFGPRAAAKDLAPDFAFTLFHGETGLRAKTLDLSDLRGKPVVLNFWAGRCPPCRVEMPEFQRFYEDFKDRVTVIGIDLGPFTDLGSREDARKLIKELGVTYSIGFTEDETVLRRFGVLAMPTTLFITGKGEIFHKWNGVLNQEALTALTLKMLNR